MGAPLKISNKLLDVRRVYLEGMAYLIFLKVTVPFWFYHKLVRSNAGKYPNSLGKLFTLQNIASDSL